MKFTAAALLLLVAVAVTGCTSVSGSGDVIAVDVPIENVSRLVVTHSFDVNVTIGETPSLTIRVDDNVESSLRVGMDGDTLRIGLEPRTTVRNGTLEADLTVPSLEAIEGSGSVDIHVEALSGSSLDLQLSGASNLDARVDFETVNAEVSGASTVLLSGRVGTMDVNASGASTLTMLDLEVDALQIDLSGASDGEVTVKNSIEGSLSGASTLRYRGDPDVNVDLSGSSDVGKVTEPG